MPGFTEEDLRAAVTVSLSFAETLRNLDYCHTGGNPRTIKKYIAIWGIDTSHFDPDFARAQALRTAPRPLSEVLVNGSAYGRASLKARLYRDTHCGRQNRKPVEPRACKLCGKEFRPRYRTHRYCSRDCGQKVARRSPRKVPRPPYEQLMAEIEASSYSAVGRKYGVSDNAIRKWVRAYEREREDGGGD